MDRTPAASSRQDSATLDEWQESIARSFVPMQVWPAPTPPAVFHASVERQQLAFMGLSLVRAEAHSAVRTERDVALRPADYYKVSYQLSGCSTVSQDGRRTLLAPGDLAVYDTTRPYALDFTGFNESLVAQLPRAEVALRGEQVARLTARSLSPAGVSASLGSLLRALADGGAPGGRAARYHLARSIAELLTAAIAAEATDTETLAPVDAALLDSLKRYALAHLSNPGLSIADVAAAHYVSARTAQRLFQREATTFAHWIRNERLDRAHQRLQSSADPITCIAQDAGFASGTHFSRAFRERYGRSAREIRRESASSPLSIRQAGR